MHQNTHFQEENFTVFWGQGRPHPSKTAGLPRPPLVVFCHSTPPTIHTTSQT